jgi:hypothetical protein
MEKTPRKVNAKMFLQDLRAGKSDDELMRLHDLTPAALNKVIGLLLGKSLLDPAELKSRGTVAPTEPEIRIPIPEPYDFTPAEPAKEIRGKEGAYQGSSFCPQCGAHVNERMLSCPECGHVLPGQERWEAVESKKGLTERIPARVLGYIIALPIGIMLFFLFKDVILPMSEATVEKRAEAVRKEIPKGKTAMEAAKDMAKQASSGVIRVETQRLIDDGIVAEVNNNYSSFTAGPRWPEMSDGEKRKSLADIRTALRRSGIATHFRLVNDAGESLALVTGQSIELYDVNGPPESAGASNEVEAQPARPSTIPDILNRIPKYRGK